MVAPAVIAPVGPFATPATVLEALLDIRPEYVADWEVYLSAIAKPFFTKGQQERAINPVWELRDGEARPFVMRLTALAPFLADGSFVIIGERVQLRAGGVHCIPAVKLVIERGVLVSQFPETVWKTTQPAAGQQQKKPGGFNNG